MNDTVLITGITGFIGAHVAQRVLEKGYAVRGTVRNAAKGKRIVNALAAQGVDTSKLDLVELNLLDDLGWEEAISGVRYVQHVASPFPLEAPSDREALVPEARAGTQRIMEHAIAAGVERVVLTSSVVAMTGRPGLSGTSIISESDWSDPDWKKLTAYPVSKTRAELSAWTYARLQNKESVLTTINPGLVLGPDTFGNAAASLGLVRAMMSGEFPRVPKVGFPIIDVRDCASIHVAAMTAKDAGGRRLIAASNALWFGEIAQILRQEFPEFRRLPKGEMPNFLVKVGAIFDDRIKAVLSDLGVFHTADNAYVTTLTGVLPRPAKEAIISAAKSLIDRGLVAA